MASYKSGFDPPPRPDTESKSRRLGNYTNPLPGSFSRRLAAHVPQPPSSNQLSMSSGRSHRELDFAHISGQTQQLQGLQSASSRQTSLPKPVNRGSFVNSRPNGYVPTVTRLPQPTHSIDPPSGPDAPSASSSYSRQPTEPQTLQYKHSHNVLRRKPSSIALVCAESDPGLEGMSSSSTSPWTSLSLSDFAHGEPLFRQNKEPGEVIQSTAPPSTDISNPIIPVFDRYRSFGDRSEKTGNRLASEIPHRLTTKDLPPPTPLSSALSMNSQYSMHSGTSGYSASPSTRYSESPGPGAYSRDTTPTSMSSQSPGVIAPLRMTPRLRQISPISSRPPITRRRLGSAPDEKSMELVDAQGLPSVRESLTSSSSTSTVRGAEKSDKAKEKKKKKKRLSPLPPSPPPRKSSQKFKNSPEEDSSPSKSSKSPAKSVMTSSIDGQSPVRMRNPALQSPAHGPPRRPSRDGTPDLQSHLEKAPPVVQSNLVSIPFWANRGLTNTGALRISPQTPSPSEINSLPHMPPRLLSPSAFPPSPEKPLHNEPTPAPAGLGIIPDFRPVANDQPAGQHLLRTPSPSTTTKSRFTLFGRRPKTTPGLTPAEAKEKVSRRGPVAGTGHEGYGRFGLRSRAGAIAGSRDRTQSSASSSQEHFRVNDPFLADRTSPVVIAGGGEIVENYNSSLELPRSESSQSSTLPRPSTESKFSQGSSRTYLSNEVNRTTLWPSLPANNKSSASVRSKTSATPEPSDTEHSAFKPSLAFRRSIGRLKASDVAALTLPKPISVYPAGGSSAASSQDASFTSDDTRYEITRPASAANSRAIPKKLAKAPRSPMKWNIFHRSHDAINPKLKPEPEPAESLPVVVALAPNKSVAYYAMIDSSEAEGDENINIEDILRDADVVNLSRVESSDVRKPLKNSPPMIHSVKISEDMPSSESVSATIVRPLVSSIPEPASWIKNNPVSAQKDSSMEQPPRRPSRLAQVGRIPKVVSARPQQTSPKSFSRPFARISVIQASPNLEAVDRQSIAVGPSPDASPDRPRSSELASPKEEDEESPQPRPFIAMSPRKNSVITTSSSSGVMSFAGTTAVIPQPGDDLEEDEVWDEYDDLISNEEALKVPPSATSSHGMPFQYERFETRKKVDDESSPAGDTGKKDLPLLLLPNSPDLATRIRDGLDTLTPTTPISFTEFFSAYGDRNNSIVSSSGGAKRVSSLLPQKDSRPVSTNSKSASVSDTRLSGDSRLTTLVEQPQESPAAQVNLRVGSMTVSKWLTFGHVLFSPARDEILASQETSKHHSVLVIDGLGNDDWSFYAAETYTMATFYNLSPSPSRNSNSNRSTALSFPQTPANHRQVQYLSTLDKFPFPRETFTVVVLRFPPSCSDPVFRNLIAESKRVLKPAGFLEMSILDLDMMNMGNRTRRAVRNLKVKISVAAPSISLAPASDTVLRTLGKRGFSDIKSCRVGVPVASTVSSKAPTSSNDAMKEMEVSLADMMKDESSAADEGITKMVAKVGRWWFMRCYEKGVMPQDDVSGSIFTDEAVLNECERWGTSFKLLVCHAQKPVVARRRTASV